MVRAAVSSILLSIATFKHPLLSNFISSLFFLFPYSFYFWSTVLQIFTKHLHAGPLLGIRNKVMDKTNPDLVSTLAEVLLTLDTKRREGHKMACKL